MTIETPDLLAPQPALGRGRPQRRRLLLISYHFPPGQATGALRWQKLVKEAGKRRWTFDVVTLHPDSLGSPDFSRLADLPLEARIYGVHAPTPSRRSIVLEGIRAIRNGLRSRERSGTLESSAHEETAAIVSPEVTMREKIGWECTRPRGWIRALRAWAYFREEGRWAAEALRVGKDLAAMTRYAAIVTCGPPHMVHRAGRLLSRATGLPWLMDMRDPWGLAPGVYASEASPLWYLLADRFERECVTDAALIATNTEPHRLALERRYPSKSRRIISVLNGCDEDLQPRSRRDHRFTIAYAGNIYIDRDPRIFFQAVAELVREEGLSPKDLGIDFLGNTDQFAGASVVALAEAEGLRGFIAVHPRRPRNEALEFLEGAAMLLSLPQAVDLAIPSKLFEYMQFDAWLLALAQHGSATEMLLRDSSADVVDPHDLVAIKTVLRERYRAYRAGNYPKKVNWDGRFDRRHQAHRLFTSMEEGLLIDVAPEPATSK